MHILKASLGVLHDQVQTFPAVKRLDRHSITIIGILGEGEFGRVYRGTIPREEIDDRVPTSDAESAPHVTVAVKTLKNGEDVEMR